MAITEKTQATAKTPEAKPSHSPTETVRAVTKAEWELGTPPAEMNHESATLFSLSEYKITLNA
jgi:hypothetical protein